MSEATEINIEQIVTACRANSDALAKSFNGCFEGNYRVDAAETASVEELQAKCDGPGLVVAFEAAGDGMVCLIPASLPLPDWYRQPDADQQSQLQTLAEQWSENMLPAGFDVGQPIFAPAENLKSHFSQQPSPDSLALELLLFADGYAADAESSEADTSDADQSKTNETDGGSAEPAGRIILLWPAQMPTAAGNVESTAAISSGTPGNAANAANRAASAHFEALKNSSLRSRLVMGLTVNVSARLAEKKIEIGQLLSLTPGSLITFNKSCEDLLDLHVNNHRYCSGEAVKIGEKFGLKINEVGVVEVRKERILP